MSKTALVFPGQGAQYTGMAKDLYESFEVAKEVIDRADSLMDFDLISMMNDEDKKSELSKTENTQPALLTHSMAIMEILSKYESFKYDACLGLSLGEYSALTAANAMDFKDAVSLVRKRGLIMSNEVADGEGAMCAVIGANRELIEECILKLESGTVEIANYNSPAQIVISGEKAAVEEAAVLLKENGAKRAIMLDVSGPFHSSLLKGAGEKLKLELDKVDMKEPSVDVVSNVDANIHKDPDEIKAILVKQVYSSVLWEDSISKLIDEGFDRFIEIGPGKTLRAFIKKIASKKKADVEIINIDTAADVNAFIESIGGETNGN
ncbi:ACP S-malonyltransferase [Peptacetobacter hiranonis]|uniref:Malonyl CoA-acyl carrier protein transacylase n=1 Tax=Peptacetobacter hiranonis (strain DSM 13275 / JCM 10541 / KCTC 15199 / TO-931) TaxID=500633 RepID=B6FZ34_PEPHT|nr:ACP S-malonyltransferase [Peptacetobacter hiranonis]EEA85204.1 [acyl-carrier-protein] S-malonyltransferase [Peptacetobacter hiranonis DSM 13275]QEK20436.1 Malonyl CoA-acyl carrier protein transacylase [Peptacetobacter hiranonis]